jgi:hypothetical protein
MKKTLIILLTAVLMSFSATKAATILKLNLEKGQTYKLKSVSQQTITQTMNGMQMNIETNNTAVLEFLPEALETDYMLVRVKFDSILSNMNMPMQSIKINTNKPGNLKNPGDLMNNVMSVLVKNPLEVKFSYTGKVIQIINAAAIHDSALRMLDSLPEASKTQMKPIVEMTVNEDALKSMIVLFSYFPDKPVEPGDKWETSVTIIPRGMELITSTKYKLKNITDGQAIINGDVTIESAENAVMNVNGMQMPFEMRGMGTSELTIDVKTGWIVNSKSKQKLQGSITFNGNAMPMDIESTSETEAIK